MLRLRMRTETNQTTSLTASPPFYRTQDIPYPIHHIPSRPILPRMCCQSDVTKWWKMISWLRVTLFRFRSERALSVHGSLWSPDVLEAAVRPSCRPAVPASWHSGILENRTEPSRGSLDEIPLGGWMENGAMGTENWEWGMHVLEVLCNRQRINTFVLPGDEVTSWGKFIKASFVRGNEWVLRIWRGGHF